MDKYLMYFSPNLRTASVVMQIGNAIVTPMPRVATSETDATQSDGHQETQDSSQVVKLWDGSSANVSAASLNVPIHLDVTSPKARRIPYEFEPTELVVIGFPTYAGKLPNKMLPFVKSIKGNGALAVAVVTYGNRSYDNSLAELVSCLQDSGFNVIAGVAAPCQHSFSDELAHGRPDQEDFSELTKIATEISGSIERFLDSRDNSTEAETSIPLKLAVPGDADAPYYTPLKADGTKAEFLKAVPKTNEEVCNRCDKCVKACPMGIISKEDCITIEGPCIKCQACVRVCPINAKYFDDPDFLSHVEMLKESYSDAIIPRREIELYLAEC